MAGETDTKTDRLMRVAREAGAGGILLTTQRNFAWLTGGATNRIDGSREPGAGSLFVRADGRRFLLANAIEMPRLLDEAVGGLGFEPVEYPWIDDQADPAVAVGLARSLTGGSAPVGADWPLPETALVETALMRARVPLVDEELERYRALGRDMGVVVGEVCHAIHPGQTERQVADSVSAAICLAGARPIVVLVAADRRLEQYRHPVPTDALWQHAVMVVVCAERHGLTVALSRIVVAGPAPAAFTDRMRATARVFGRVVDATRPGATGSQIFDVVARAYEEAGYAGEERLHHQGGATGYRSREWVAHPRSSEVVSERQAFAWNPSITGTKIEDTTLVIDGRIEMLTATPGWPRIPLLVNGASLHAADALVI